MLGIAYGYSPSTIDDEYIKMTEDAIKLILEGGGPGSMLVDFLPVRESYLNFVLLEREEHLSRC